MMRNVGGPEQTAHMVNPMQPVIHKIFKHQQDYPVYPWVFNGCHKTMVIKEGKDETDIDNAECKVNATVEQHKINILCRILQGVSILFAEFAEKQLQPNHYNVDWSSDENE